MNGIVIVVVLNNSGSVKRAKVMGFFGVYCRMEAAFGLYKAKTHVKTSHHTSLSLLL
jgi:hypothetical protein